MWLATGECSHQQQHSPHKKRRVYLSTTIIRIFALENISERESETQPHPQQGLTASSRAHLPPAQVGPHSIDRMVRIEAPAPPINHHAGNKKKNTSTSREQEQRMYGFDPSCSTMQWRRHSHCSCTDMRQWRTNQSVKTKDNVAMPCSNPIRC